MVAVFTSLLLGLEGGNASMMEECQVTWQETSLPPLPLKKGDPPWNSLLFAPENRPPGSLEIPFSNQNHDFFRVLLLKL